MQFGHGQRLNPEDAGNSPHKLKIASSAIEELARS